MRGPGVRTATRFLARGCAPPSCLHRQPRRRTAPLHPGQFPHARAPRVRRAGPSNGGPVRSQARFDRPSTPARSVHACRRTPPARRRPRRAWPRPPRPAHRTRSWIRQTPPARHRLPGRGVPGTPARLARAALSRMQWSTSRAESAIRSGQVRSVVARRSGGMAHLRVVARRGQRRGEPDVSGRTQGLERDPMVVQHKRRGHVPAGQALGPGLPRHLRNAPAANEDGHCERPKPIDLVQRGF